MTTAADGVRVSAVEQQAGTWAEELDVSPDAARSSAYMTPFTIEPWRPLSARSAALRCLCLVE